MSDRALADLGFTRGQISYRMEKGVLVRNHPGVLTLGPAPLTFEGRAAAACQWRADGYVTDRTSGVLLGLRGLTKSVIDVALPDGRTSRAPEGIRLRRTVGIDPDEDVVDRGDGIRQASTLLTLYGLAAILPRAALEQVAQDAWHKQLFTLDEADAFLARHRRSGRDGTERFEQLLQRLHRQQRPHQSGFEVTLRQAMEAIGLPTPVAQHPVLLPNGIEIHLDLALVDVRLDLETDGTWWHLHRGPWDRERDRLLRQIGWEVLRFGDEELQDPMRCARVVADTYRRRRAALSRTQRDRAG